MKRRLPPLKPLIDDQALAADPQVHATLSASAGTGKTHVLTARVLRLLLGGVAPETILCLTFTKAGAAEMSNRIGARLAAWVRMGEADLKKELFALGEPNDPPMLERARRLFARVLEAPGGLRIQTIHAFAQALLASFPAEAGITPGFRPLEGRAEQELARRTLADLAADAEAAGDEQLIADIQALSLRLGEQGAESYLLTCARHPEGMAALGASVGVEAALREIVGLPAGDVDAAIVAALADDELDNGLFDALLRANRAWGPGKKATQIVDNITAFLAASAAERAGMLGEIGRNIVKADGEPCAIAAGQLAGEPDYAQWVGEFAAWRAELLGMKAKAALVAVQAAGLRAGQRFAAAYAAAKRANGVADFDDLIRWSRALLEQPGMGEWVRFKLDRRTDHILVDEAQDTNDDQWAIVDALKAEFFSGSSEADERWRTLFMVGDFKQAIYSFQGTDPASFEEMRRRTRAEADRLAAAALDDPDLSVREFRELSIAASFRSSPAVLQLVDAVIAEVGHETMGLPERPRRHDAFHGDRFGRVEWWPALNVEESAAESGADAGEEEWIDDNDRAHAKALAQQVKALIDSKQVLAATRKPVSAGDILVLVRSRGELASLIVARLFAERVPVAGIDRLHLHRPLAVKDLLAAVGFAVQPLDDLNLANLLVSPLIGWSQDDLYAVAFGRGEQRLWSALQDAKGADPVDAALEVLGQLLRMADYTTPAEFLEAVLSGPIQGRRKLLGRLGPEARDPIEELLGAALEFERNETASLDRFMAWFGSGDVEIKRDPSAPADAVRVMTVHGAKGLEAPIVILADATADPDKLGPSSPPVAVPVEGVTVPMIRPRKAERCSPFAELLDKQSELDRAEHLRLLYVALTRAEERLIISGVRKKNDSAMSWHAIVARAMESVGATGGEDGILAFESGTQPGGRAGRAKRESPALGLPEWLGRQAPEEQRPPRPLAPSALAEDQAPYPPPAPGELDSARRGTLLHALFERLPGVDAAVRRDAALKWLAASAGGASDSERAEIADLACGVIGDPAYADIFGPSALAEAPIAAVLADGQVVAGAVDRLLVEEDRVTVVDFKTGRGVPDNAAAIPPSHRLQMEAYRAALAVIFPGRTVEAALLYTAGPKILRVDG